VESGVNAPKGKPKHEPAPAPQTRPLAAGTFSLAGRASPLELIMLAANATNADGIGRVLSFDEGRSEPRR
jgi:hypothetical protein